MGGQSTLLEVGLDTLGPPVEVVLLSLSPFQTGQI